MLRSSRKLNIIGLVVCLGGLMTQFAAAQRSIPGPPKTEPRPRPERVAPPEPPAFPSEGRRMNERALAVDPNVNIKIPCISEARVTVTGWSRNEVRVFIRNGSNVKIQVHEKDPKSGKPVWILISRQNPGFGDNPMTECLTGERIDIEVPFGAALDITGRETETRVDSVRKVKLENAGGDVALRNVSGGISSRTYEGSVTLENSSGQIVMETTSGNILAYDVKPGQIGDLFKAKTSNGKITLQNVEHRQITADSVSGEVAFSGKFLPGGLYSLKTTAGSIRMAIPGDSSCRVTALYGGTMNSAIPYKTITKNISPAGNTLNAVFGEGDATVKLWAQSGRIIILKL